ncbi:MAG: LPS assembly lipoprotein LptE [Bacteroidales bacterium]|nr:LPS assembly lipoprotein LptE [Bacteroidales bacterium]MCL2133143.1 LPS assembly lipoprotein LptE [Bacteroidales bacterium]
MSIRKHIVAATVLLSLLCWLQGCKGGYSFTGTSISPEVETVSIDYINNMAMIVYPPLSNSLTESLKDKFTRTTRLSLVSYDGDLHFEGEVTGYDVTSMGVTADEVASVNRLNVTVKIRFTNNKDEQQSYDKSFSQYADFDSARTLDSVQAELVDEIIEKLIEDIFNNAVANW